MNARELVNLLGKEASLDMNGLTVPVHILDARECFGRTDVKVSPVGGSGECWVNGDRVRIVGRE